MTKAVRGFDVKKTAQAWFKQASNLDKDYFWRCMKSHKENSKPNGDYPYCGIHAETYKLMVNHPGGQEYLKIVKLK